MTLTGLFTAPARKANTRHQAVLVELQRRWRVRGRVHEMAASLKLETRWCEEESRSNFIKSMTVALQALSSVHELADPENTKKKTMSQ